ncbi:MAG: hypothetical protein NC204_05285 [Candidatus Amulumruptor caecigallinarius]|nr:hypothetical protein [Candidatus Amulumruptor caecigallinarius]
MKKFISIALFCAITPLASFAQNKSAVNNNEATCSNELCNPCTCPADYQCNPQCNVCVAPQQNCDEPCVKDCTTTPKHKANRKDKSCKSNPFANLNLSEDQKSKIKTLGSENRKAKTEFMQKAGTARENKDTTFKFKKGIKELKTNYLKGLREILTSDQYIQFLENNYVNNSGSKIGGKHGMKSGKSDFKKDRSGKHGKAKIDRKCKDASACANKPDANLKASKKK